MPRIISERNLDIDEERYVCFTVWQKTFDCVIGPNYRRPWKKMVSLARNKTDLQFVHGSKCQSTTGPRGDKTYEDWKRN
jgi:hypothetical protein